MSSSFRSSNFLPDLSNAKLPKSFKTVKTCGCDYCECTTHKKKGLKDCALYHSVIINKDKKNGEIIIFSDDKGKCHELFKIFFSWTKKPYGHLEKIDKMIPGPGLSYYDLNMAFQPITTGIDVHSIIKFKFELSQMESHCGINGYIENGIPKGFSVYFNICFPGENSNCPMTTTEGLLIKDFEDDNRIIIQAMKKELLSDVMDFILNYKDEFQLNIDVNKFKEKCQISEKNELKETKVSKEMP